MTTTGDYPVAKYGLVSTEQVLAYCTETESGLRRHDSVADVRGERVTASRKEKRSSFSFLRLSLPYLFLPRYSLVFPSSPRASSLLSSAAIGRFKTA